jgi:hypothetical protein
LEWTKEGMQRGNEGTGIANEGIRWATYVNYREWNEYENQIKRINKQMKR